MSSARNTFWTVTARGNGACAWPRKYGMNWFIPAFVSSRPDSGGGISDDEGTTRCSRSSKKRRNDARISRPSIGKASLPGGSRPAAHRVLFGRQEFGLLVAHRLLALGDRLGDELREVEHPAAGLAGEPGGRHLLALAAEEARRHDRGRRPGPEAEGQPEQPSHGAALPRPLPPNRLEAFRSPAPTEMILTSGPDTACSTRLEIRRTRPTISSAATSIPSTRSSSRFVRSTDPFTSRSSGTVSSRIASMISFVLSSTRNVLMSTMHRNSTSSPQKAESTMRATSPPSSAAITACALLAARVRASYRWRRAGVLVGLLALPRGLVVPRALEPGRPVLLLDHVSRVIVRVPVLLAEAQLLQPRVSGRLLQMERHGVGRTRVLGRLAEGRDHAVRFRGAGEVDRGLGEVQLRLGQPDVLHRVRGGHGDEQRPRVGEPDVLARVHDHPPRDV